VTTIALLKQLVADLEAAKEQAAKPADGKPLPRFMTIQRYAEHSGYSARQVSRFIRLGLPVTHAPGERWPRVVVAAADAWIVRGGAGQAVEASAKMASLRAGGQR
jgi:SH3-like domain-containing protein